MAGRRITAQVAVVGAGLAGLWISGTNLWLSFGSLFTVLLGCVFMTPLITLGWS